MWRIHFISSTNWIDVHLNTCTIIILSFWTERSGQTVQTQIRLLLKGSSLIRVYTVCNSLCIFWLHYSKEKPSCSTFRVITANFRVSEILGFLRYSPSEEVLGQINLSKQCRPTADQTTSNGTVWSGSALFASHFKSFWCITYCKTILFKF